MTTFTAGPKSQTLPIWIFDNLFRANQAPVVNVIAVILIVLSILPVWFAKRLGGTGRPRAVSDRRDSLPTRAERAAGEATARLLARAPHASRVAPPTSRVAPRCGGSAPAG